MKDRTKQTFRIYWDHSRRYPIQLTLMVIGLVGAVSTGIYIPLVYKDFFDALASGSATAEVLINILATALIFSGVEWIFWRIATFANNYFQPRVMADLIVTCFKYIQNHSFNYFNNNFAGSLVRKVNRYERAYEDITDIFYWDTGHTILRIGLIVAIVFTRSRILALTMVVWCIIYVLGNYWFAQYKLKFDVRKADIDTKVTGQLADTITNNINLKLFTSNKREVSSFVKLIESLFRMRQFTWNLSGFSEAFQAAMLAILQFLVFFLAIRYWQAGQLSVGDFALLQAYVVQIFGRLWDLTRHIRQLYERLADAEEMTEILMTPHEIQDKPNAGKMNVASGLIEFSKVTFGYENSKKILSKFNLIIKPGERVALIGPSGGGKTTIVKLLFRFMDIAGGEIKIDGKNIADVTQDSLRENLALVPQEPILFHRSLYDNIAYARPNASKEEVYKAAKLAHCHEFISGFEKGYDSFVGDRGVKLSGGERQRVAIARAILKNAPILVLDEATSSLDSESESFIQEALRNLMKGKTTIVIAHRLSTIMQMDRIIVIEDGKIKEEGKHEELVKAQQGTYQKLWEIQAGGFSSITN